MTAGLPGTGIGGIFYMLMALFMPFVEIRNMLAGKPTSLQRWGFIGLQWAFVGGIYAVLWGESWLLERGIFWLQDNFPAIVGYFASAKFQAVKFSGIACTITSFVTLLAVVGLVQIAGAIIHRPKVAKTSAAAEVA